MLGAALARLHPRNGGELNNTEMAREQGVRVSRLCVNLKAMLRRYTEGDEAGFEVGRDGTQRVALATSLLLRCSAYIGASWQ